jgi:hypothetical protein
MICKNSAAAIRPFAYRSFPPRGDKGLVYEVTAYVKPLDAGLEAAAGANVVLGFLDGAADDPGSNLATTQPGWVLVQGTLMATRPDAATGRVNVLGDPNEAHGDCVLFDDVRLVVHAP